MASVSIQSKRGLDETPNESDASETNSGAGLGWGGVLNPTWTRDELILCLDFYVRHSPKIPGKKSTEVAELSELLNRLRITAGLDGDETFRNPNGVYMKLMNFRRFDPDYPGKGLERGGNEDEVVWNRYHSDPSELHTIAEAIGSFVALEPEHLRPGLSDDEEIESEEGRVLTRVHRYRERDPKLAQQKKSQALEAIGRLVCEACGFDFEVAYGDHGSGFIECHHTKPVSQLQPGEKTKIGELALVCSNCHRMIHRRRPWLSLAELRLGLQRQP